MRFAAATSAVTKEITAPGSVTVSVTESVEVGAVTGTVEEAAATGTMEEAAVTGSVEGAGAAGEGDTWEVALAEAAFLACSSWWRAARRRFFSLSTGPRWRGRQEGEEVGGEGGGEKAGMEWGAPGCPRVQLKPTVVKPPLVERLREALPPLAQTERNSVTDATTN